MRGNAPATPRRTPKKGILDVRRPDGDASSEDEVVRRFAARFKEKVWPVGAYLSFVTIPERSTSTHIVGPACTRSASWSMSCRLSFLRRTSRKPLNGETSK